MRFTRRLVAVTGALVMAAGAVVGAAPVSAAPSVVPAKTYKACANKSSGAIRLVVKGKKCKKGEIKLEWNAQGPAGMAGPVGPQGPQGEPGPVMVVRDGNGTVLGTLLHAPVSPFSYWVVLFEGGAYEYELLSEAGSDRRAQNGVAEYLTNTCTGTPFFLTIGTVDDPGAGGPERLVQTFSDGTAAAFAFSGAPSTTVGVVTPAWYRNKAKACVPTDEPVYPSAKLIPLTAVTPPPFAVGQIHIG